MSSKEKIFFKNKTLKMAGELYFPTAFDDTEKYPNIVVPIPAMA